MVVIGPPGSGKSSVSRRLAEKGSAARIEVGDMLRDEVERQTDLGRRIEEYVASGQLAPTELVVEALAPAFERARQPTLILDGFPRNMQQVEPLLTLMREHDRPLAGVLALELDREVAFKRLTGRRVCEGCGRMYNVYFDPPPKDDACGGFGGELTQREDDRPEVVNDRLDVYERQTRPVVEYFRREHADKVETVDAAGSLEEVTAEAGRAMDRLLERSAAQAPGKS